MFSKRTRYDESPKINATIFSRISFHYLNGLFALGAKTPIEEKDLWNPTPNNLGEITYQLIAKSETLNSLVMFARTE